MLFRSGAARNGLSEAKADEVFDLMEKFAGYGFNKSHAAAYSLLAYHTAWLKVHYTAEFFCANMTVEMDDTDKLKVLYQDALKFGMSFDPPDVNRGHYRFEPVTDKVIVWFPVVVVTVTSVVSLPVNVVLAAFRLTWEPTVQVPPVVVSVN